MPSVGKGISSHVLGFGASSHDVGFGKRKPAPKKAVAKRKPAPKKAVAKKKVAGEIVDHLLASGMTGGSIWDTLGSVASSVLPILGMGMKKKPAAKKAPAKRKAPAKKRVMRGGMAEELFM